MTCGGLRLIRFLVLFLVLSMSLCWPFAPVGRRYVPLVCFALNGLVTNSTQTPMIARTLPDERPGFEWSAIIAVWAQTTKSLEAKFPIDIHQLFYLPTAVFAALALSSKWAFGNQRILPKLLVGIALLQMRPIPLFLSRERAVIGLFRPDGLFDVILVVASRSLVAPLGMAFALPLLLWFGLFRRSLFRTQHGSEG
jgi:hypothetical protein